MKRINSIRAGLTGFALVFVAGTFIVTGLTAVSVAGNFITARFHESFRLLGENLSNNAELGLLLNDRSMLKRLADNMLEQRDIRKVYIYGTDGLVAEAGSSAGKGLLRITVPVVVPSMDNAELFERSMEQEKEIGRVELAYSLESLEELKSKMIFRLILFFAALSAFSFFWYRLFARSITKPLKDLMNAAGQVSKGNLNITASGGIYQETRTLAAAFNNMLAALKKSGEELEDAYMKMAHQKSMAEVGKFSMMVAHEIKNPLSIIRGSADILAKEGTKGEARQEMIHYQKTEIHRINTLIEDFLAYARPLEPRYERCEINRIVEKIRKKSAAMWESEGVALSLDIANGTDVLVYCDGNLLEKVITNILKNAFHVSRPGDTIRMQTFADDKAWHLKIADNGPGIDPSGLSDVFKPFYTTKSTGTGLGLAIAEEIIHAHGGRVTVENGANGGAVFQITLTLLNQDSSKEVQYG